VKHYTQITPPTQEPLTVADVATFVKAAGGPEDTATIATMIGVAREHAEGFTGRALLTSVWRLVSDSWTGEDNCPNGKVLTLDRSPLASVASVKYYAEDEDTLTTLVANTDYIVITGTTPGRIQLLIDPPALEDRADAVQVEFTAGATSPSGIPPTLVHAVRFISTHYWENRGVNGTFDPTDIPKGAIPLLESQRVGGWVG
jgi:uncharacterized phiE125 gp8 family phage protein